MNRAGQCSLSNGLSVKFSALTHDSTHRWMVAFSMIYILAAIVLYHFGFGDSSLVFANIFNLTVRIIYSFSFATVFFKRFPQPHLLQLKDVLPSWSLCLACSISALVIQASANHFYVSDISRKLGKAALLNSSVLLHLAVGTALGVSCLLTWWITSGSQLVTNYSHRKKD